MEAFTQLEGLTALMDRINVDTDQIIPKQFLKKIERTGFGKHLFHDWRYLNDAGTESNPEFVLNEQRYQGAQILIARDNFGCGSSREHAPWALLDYGFRCIIAPSFADIFFNNCRKNGILLVVLEEGQVDSLFKEVLVNEGCSLKVDLEQKEVLSPDGLCYSFEIDDFARQCLLGGMDDIGWTLQFEERISIFEKKSTVQSPWLHLSA